MRTSRTGRKPLALLVATLVAGLVVAASARADEPRRDEVTWRRGPLSPVSSALSADTVDAVPSDTTAREILTGNGLVANRSRELIAVVGALGAPAYGTMGAVLYDKSPGAGVGFIGAGAAAGAVLVGALAPPTLNDVRAVVASGSKGEEAVSSADMARSVERLVARERTIRKITSGVAMAGAATAIVGAVATVPEHRDLAAFLGLVGLLHGTLAVNDWVSPWEIEARAEKAKASGFVLTGAVTPTPTGVTATLVGQF